MQLKQTEAIQKQQEQQLKSVQDQQKVVAQNAQNHAKRVGQIIDNTGKAENLAFERETRASATEALLHGPTIAPHG